MNKKLSILALALMHVLALLLTACTASNDVTGTPDVVDPTPYIYEPPEARTEAIARSDSAIAEYLMSLIEQNGDYIVDIESTIKYSTELPRADESEPDELVYNRVRKFQVTSSRDEESITIQYWVDSVNWMKRRHYTLDLVSGQTSAIETVDEGEEYRNVIDKSWTIRLGDDALEIDHNNETQRYEDLEIFEAFRALFFPENISMFEGTPRVAIDLEDQILYWKYHNLDGLNRPFRLLLDMEHNSNAECDTSYDYHFQPYKRVPLIISSNDKSKFMSEVFPVFAGEEVVATWNEVPYSFEVMKLELRPK